MFFCLCSLNITNSSEIAPPDQRTMYSKRGNFLDFSYYFIFNTASYAAPRADSIVSDDAGIEPVLWNRNYFYGSGSGSGSYFWKVMVPVPVPVPTLEKVMVPVPVPTFEKLRFRFRFCFQLHM